MQSRIASNPAAECVKVLRQTNGNSTSLEEDQDGGRERRKNLQEPTLRLPGDGRQ
jgi:hypothetical protein